MQQVRLKKIARDSVATERFGGCEHTPEVADGAWYEAENLSNDRFPRFSVRRARSQAGTLGGLSMDGVIALCGNDRLVALYEDGRIGCGGRYKTLLQTARTAVGSSALGEVTVSVDDFYALFLDGYGRYRFLYDRTNEVWDVALRVDGAWVTDEHSPVALADVGVTIDWQPDDQDGFTVEYRLRVSNQRRTMVEMGAFVCIWPDQKFCNVEKLAAGSTLTGDDYGEIGVDSLIPLDGKTLSLTLCDKDGVAFEPMTVSTEEPEIDTDAKNYWMDLSENKPSVKYWSASLNGWFPVPSCCVKVGLVNVGSDLAAGDGVTLDFQPPRSWYMGGGSSDPDPLQPTYDSVRKLLGGTAVLLGSDADEIVIPGCFVLPAGNSATWSTTISQGGAPIEPYLRIRRTVPQMDFVVECGNRLWGCYYGVDAAGQVINEIYACKLGDFRNWNVFQGLSTDSYAASRGTAGPFTGAAVLNGCPLFFRENSLEKVFPATTGSSAGAHQIQTVTLDGVQQGCDRSLCVIDNKLYYKGVGGVYVYAGSLPKLISGALGDVAYKDAEAGRHGKKYVVTMEVESGKWKVESGGARRVFVYDTQTGLWQPEDDVNAGGQAGLVPVAVNGLQRVATYQNQAYLLQWAADGFRAKIWAVDGAADARGVHWYAESGALGADLPERKYIARIHLRWRLELGAAARVYVMYDEDGVWQLKGTLLGERLHSGVLTIRPRRCDTFRLKLEGVGGLELYDVSYERERGSDC